MEKVDISKWREILTPAERRVVEALLNGASPKKLSAAFGIKVSTVYAEIRSVKRKLGYSGPRERMLLDLLRASVLAPTQL